MFVNTPRKKKRRGVAAALTVAKSNTLDLLGDGLLEHAIDLLVDCFNGGRIRLRGRQSLVRRALRARGGRLSAVSRSLRGSRLARSPRRVALQLADL